MSYDGPISPPRPAKNAFSSKKADGSPISAPKPPKITFSSKKAESPNVLEAFQTLVDQTTQQCYLAGSYTPDSSLCLTLHIRDNTLASNMFEFIYNHRIYHVQIERTSTWEGRYVCQEREGARPAQHGNYGLCHYNRLYNDPDIKNTPQTTIRQQDFKYTIHLRGFQP